MEARKPRKNIEYEAGASAEETEQKLAALLTSPELAAYRVINSAEAKSGLGAQIDVPHLIEQLRREASAVNRGDLTHAEAMLMNQANALQSLFARLTERAMSHDTVVGFEVNMRMALRAQSQCRTTLESLAAIKNPPVVYARQANIASGPQQVNNGMPPPTRAGEKEIAPNRLLENDDGQRLDARAPGTASRADTELEAVGALDRTEDA